VIVTARRSRIAPGRAAEYAAFHAAIPESLAEQLRDAGVLSWEIWIDGETLFHRIATVDGYDAMVLRADDAQPRHPDWQQHIDVLLSSEEGADVLLAPVWTLDGSGQRGGAA
jgi:L-rhamnose mutarotase